MHAHLGVTQRYDLVWAPPDGLRIEYWRSIPSTAKKHPLRYCRQAGSGVLGIYSRKKNGQGVKEHYDKRSTETKIVWTVPFMPSMRFYVR